MNKLNIGTIIRADKNWSIRDIVDDQDNMIITVEKPSEGTYNKDSNLVTPVEHYDTYGHGVSKGVTENKISSLLERIEDAGITLNGKYFIIMTMNGFGKTHPKLNTKPNRHMSYTLAAAIECTETGDIIEDGLSIEFRTCSYGNDQTKTNTTKGLNNPEITGQMTLKFG